jgi:kinesin family protein 18/19
MELLFQGNKERTQEPTAANKTSSRSHAVLQVIVKQQNRVRNTLQEIRVGKLFMIDLAGSERAANTHNTGKRMVEGAHINRSLLALGNCINADLPVYSMISICFTFSKFFFFTYYRICFIL